MKRPIVKRWALDAADGRTFYVYARTLEAAIIKAGDLYGRGCTLRPADTRDEASSAEGSVVPGGRT